MSAVAETVGPGAVQRILEHARARGFASRVIADDAGIDSSALAAGKRTPISAVYNLWSLLGRKLDDPALPISVAREACLEDQHLLGFAALTAASAADALAVVERHGRVVTDSGQWRVERRGAEIAVEWQRPATTLGERLSNETAIAQLVQCMRQLVGADFEPDAVGFRHAAPSQASAHRAFFRSRIAFGATYDGIRFHRRALATTPPCANAGLHAYLLAELERTRPQVQAGSLSETVRRLARAELDRGRVPVLAIAARSLAKSERSLRRALEQEGTSFRVLCDEVRAERARQLLGGGRSATEVAFELGFSDVSAFSHAHRRWFGRSPRGR